MIAKISGKVINKTEDSVSLDINGICYEVLIPGAIMNCIDSNVDENGILSLVTYHYLQIEPSRGYSFLIGFLNEIEKEFFEKFITVSGIGPKAACRALKMPISVISQAIDTGDISVLKSLPGIGTQRAKEIIAKLQGKVGKFGLIQDNVAGTAIPVKGKETIKEEAMDVLSQLQYKKFEANNMIEAALKRNPDIKTAEELLNEVYKQKTKQG